MKNQKNLFQQLSKENQSRVSLTSTKQALVGNISPTGLTMSQATDIFWDVYPSNIFDLDKYYALFKD